MSNDLQNIGQTPNALSCSFCKYLVIVDYHYIVHIIDMHLRFIQKLLKPTDMIHALNSGVSEPSFGRMANIFLREFKQSLLATC